ncbi:MAG: glycosyltransferase [Chlorobiaceae bacterium]
MRIVLDLQKVQRTLCSGCIDSYSLSFTQALVRNRDNHEIIIALSALFPDSIELIRSLFDKSLSQNNIRVWYTPSPVNENPCNTWHRETAELIREAFLASIKPDILHTFSLFEGYLENSVSSIGIFDKVSCHSVLLPEYASLISNGSVLKSDQRYSQYYLREYSYLRRASLYFAISESSRQDWIIHGTLPADNVICIPDTPDESQQVLWDSNAQIAISAFEEFYKRKIKSEVPENSDSSVERHNLITAIAELDNSTCEEHLLIGVAEAIAKNIPNQNSKKQLLVDISELVQRDARTGIQRVVRSILKELLEQPPENFRVEPIYATKENSYRYARRFTAKFMNVPQSKISDEIVEVFSGDIFFGLDYQADIIPIWADFFRDLRHRGIKTIFLVYDLLPYRNPEWFSKSSKPAFVRWLHTIVQADGVVCISKTIAFDLITWLDTYLPLRSRPLKIGWSHIGADIPNHQSSAGFSEKCNRQLVKICIAQSILMVGTIEPRKGHAQTLEAFELLWKQGIDINLVIVGKEGWKVDKLSKKIKKHEELNKRLFWLQGISDDALLTLYEAVKGVLMASEGEGFGLPLIEAAQYARPILARDLNVFREVAGGFATYFSGSTPEELAYAIQNWLELLNGGNAPNSKGMPWLTWKQCTEQMLALITDPDHPNWLCNWLPGNQNKGSIMSDERLNIEPQYSVVH